MKNVLANLVVCFAALSMAHSQEGPPNEMLARTAEIKVGNVSGTGFLFDYGNKRYFVTAKHVVKDLKDNGTLQVQKPDGWKDYTIGKILLPPCGDADIAVLETHEAIDKPYEVVSGEGNESVILGQAVFFIGYPFGLHSMSDKYEFAFIKRGTMSAVDARDKNSIVLYIDGFNNPGFSGAPIMYWNFDKRAFRLLGVVQGYKEDTAKVLINNEHVNTALLVNSGILVGYSIEHAVQAIKREACAVKK